MTAVAVPAAARPDRRATTPEVAWALAKRSLLATIRVPAGVLPLVLMPLFFVVIFAGTFSELTKFPHFPTDNVLDWMVPFSIMQGAAFAGMGTAFGTVRDMNSGFYDRILLMPGARAGVLLAPIMASAVRCLFTVGVVFAFGMALGADLPGGLAGVVALFGASLAVSTICVGWALGIVYRLPNFRAAALIQVGIFFVTFLSTGNVPLADQTGWVHGVARLNPFTNILELSRQGMVGHVTWSGSWPGLVALAGSGVVLWAFALRGVRKYGQ
jgi:ABC-2 type transport system permease protein